MLKATAVKIVHSLKKRFIDMARKPTKHKQTNNRPNFFDPEYVAFEKKTGPGLIRTRHLPSQSYLLPPD